MLESDERGDIVGTMHQALERGGLAEALPVTPYHLHRNDTTERIVISRWMPAAPRRSAAKHGKWQGCSKLSWLRKIGRVL